jgi:hypothetical protein
MRTNEREGYKKQVATCQLCRETSEPNLVRRTRIIEGFCPKTGVVSASPSHHRCEGGSGDDSCPS